MDFATIATGRKVTIVLFLSPKFILWNHVWSYQPGLDDFTRTRFTSRLHACGGFFNFFAKGLESKYITSLSIGKKNSINKCWHWKQFINKIRRLKCFLVFRFSTHGMAINSHTRKRNNLHFIHRSLVVKYLKVIRCFVMVRSSLGLP